MRQKWKNDRRNGHFQTRSSKRKLLDSRIKWNIFKMSRLRLACYSFLCLDMWICMWDLPGICRLFQAWLTGEKGVVKFLGSDCCCLVGYQLFAYIFHALVLIILMPRIFHTVVSPTILFVTFEIVNSCAQENEIVDKWGFSKSLGKYCQMKCQWLRWILTQKFGKN